MIQEIRGLCPISGNMIQNFAKIFRVPIWKYFDPPAMLSTKMPPKHAKSVNCLPSVAPPVSKWPRSIIAELWNISNTSEAYPIPTRSKDSLWKVHLTEKPTSWWEANATKMGAKSTGTRHQAWVESITWSVRSIHRFLVKGLCGCPNSVGHVRNDMDFWPWWTKISWVILFSHIFPVALLFDAQIMVSMVSSIHQLFDKKTWYVPFSWSWNSPPQKKNGVFVREKNCESQDVQKCHLKQFPFCSTKKMEMW